MSLGLSHSLSRFKLKFSQDQINTMVVQAIALLDDLDKEIDLYAMRVKNLIAHIYALCDEVISISEYRAQLSECRDYSLMRDLCRTWRNTLQILGVEKALSRVLKTKHDNYGLIYRASLIGQAPPKLKGKITHMVATKTAPSLRADALTDAGGKEPEPEPAAVDKDADAIVMMDEKEGAEEKRRKRRKSDVANAVAYGGAVAMESVEMETEAERKAREFEDDVAGLRGTPSGVKRVAAFRANLVLAINTLDPASVQSTLGFADEVPRTRCAVPEYLVAVPPTADLEAVLELNLFELPMNPSYHI
ncbi:hypothetical protein BJV74DRAFT_891299 [Russula compacta]|nr:hypothetical protein BJV74DRAFT_891299 [Russula compacta]